MTGRVTSKHPSDLIAGVANRSDASPRTHPAPVNAPHPSSAVASRRRRRQYVSRFPIGIRGEPHGCGACLPPRRGGRFPIGLSRPVGAHAGHDGDGLRAGHGCQQVRVGDPPVAVHRPGQHPPAPDRAREEGEQGVGQPVEDALQPVEEPIAVTSREGVPAVPGEGLVEGQLAHAHPLGEAARELAEDQRRPDPLARDGQAVARGVAHHEHAVADRVDHARGEEPAVLVAGLAQVVPVEEVHEVLRQSGVAGVGGEARANVVARREDPVEAPPAVARPHVEVQAVAAVGLSRLHPEALARRARPAGRAALGSRRAPPRRLDDDGRLEAAHRGVDDPVPGSGDAGPDEVGARALEQVGAEAPVVEGGEVEEPQALAVPAGVDDDLPMDLLHAVEEVHPLEARHGHGRRRGLAVADLQTVDDQHAAADLTSRGEAGERAPADDRVVGLAHRAGELRDRRGARVQGLGHRGEGLLALVVRQSLAAEHALLGDQRRLHPAPRLVLPPGGGDEVDARAGLGAVRVEGGRAHRPGGHVGDLVAQHHQVALPGAHGHAPRARPRGPRGR